ncbi:P-loop containing nucleoside triphosphate hydrolase protein [Gilbertella persicaria]|uniref:P-loop containing nucleoside triphosphate hydrolase protein n=1 Tax=Gilbertella persicaria TaxID=101096 RepID=UPI00221E7517|nr:P-loop containing nucleoside triphosphate hydrolase protein [Gilbertella persicaria]KAI8047536.1 P-loop containing nucleoside triphosphate hydrolase protein [Gilbertella persicaria]
MTFDSVRVVLRARPLRENEEMSNIVFKEQQVILNQRTFTFDAVYPPSSVQKDVYDYSIKPLFDCFMKGENGVIFAYGQTGAGKTYSLGTSSKSELDPSEEGILPRFTRSLFQQITDDCEVYVSFVSLNDEIHDLLVYPELVTILDIQDARQKRVYSTHDLLRLLSKRKLPKKCHRLFTVTLKQSETVSKFCFVDLAEKNSTRI